MLLPVEMGTLTLNMPKTKKKMPRRVKRGSTGKGRKARGTRKTTMGQKGKKRLSTAVIGQYMSSQMLPTAANSWNPTAAPIHEEYGRGLRMHFETSNWQLSRSSSDATLIFSQSGYSHSSLRTNPLVAYSTSSAYASVLYGAVASAIPKLYTLYTIRKMHVRYTPSTGLTEVGNVAFAFRRDMNQTSASYTETKQYEGAFVGSLNREFEFDAIVPHQLGKAASKLYYVDSTNSSLELYEMGALVGATDVLQSSTSKVMGDLTIEIIMDCYCLQGNSSPSASKTASATIASASTSSVTASSASSLSSMPFSTAYVMESRRIPKYEETYVRVEESDLDSKEAKADSKEAKEKKDDKKSLKVPRT